MNDLQSVGQAGRPLYFLILEQIEPDFRAWQVKFFHLIFRVIGRHRVSLSLKFISLIV